MACVTLLGWVYGCGFGPRWAPGTALAGRCEYLHVSSAVTLHGDRRPAKAAPDTHRWSWVVTPNTHSKPQVNLHQCAQFATPDRFFIFATMAGARECWVYLLWAVRPHGRVYGVPTKGMPDVPHNLPGSYTTCHSPQPIAWLTLEGTGLPSFSNNHRPVAASSSKSTPVSKPSFSRR